MHIDSDSIKTNDIPSADTARSSESKRGIGAIIQRVSNAPLWREPFLVTGLACGALITFAAYAGTSVISSAVNDINDLLAPCETLSPETYGEVMIVGVKYGLSGGIITGLLVAALIRRCVNITNLSGEYDQFKRHLLSMGAASGLSFGGIAGMLYAGHLQQVHNHDVDANHSVCYGHPPVTINERSFNM